MLVTANRLLAELTREAATTRRVLERVPENQLAWAPHPKSMTLGRLALHVAQVPGALAELLQTPGLDVPSFTPPEPASLDEVLRAHDAGLVTARAIVAAWDEEVLDARWRLTSGGRTLIDEPRYEVARAIMLNHVYHHRGQLTVYLRLLNVPVPATYGPSADESPFG